jgi:hypothetical protein
MIAAAGARLFRDADQLLARSADTVARGLQSASDGGIVDAAIDAVDARALGRAGAALVRVARNIDQALLDVIA